MSNQLSSIKRAFSEDSAVYLFSVKYGPSTETQLSQTLSFLKSQGIQNYTIYEDSDLNPGRPMLNKLLGDIDKKAIKNLICWRIDSLSTLFKDIDDFLRFLDRLSSKNVNFISVADGISLESSAKDFMRQILAAFDCLKNSFRAERLRASFRKAKSRGKSVGRPKMRDDQNIYRLRNEGLTMREIAERLGTNIPAVQRALRTRHMSKF